MNYELTVILPEEAKSEDVMRIVDIIHKHDGTIKKYTSDGVKRLAYPITKERLHEQGLYVYFEINDLSYEAMRGVNEDLDYYDNALRYLLVKQDPVRVELEKRAGNY